MNESSSVPEKEPNLPQDSTGSPRSWFSAAGRFVVELVEVVLISLAIILPIRYFLIQPFYVKGASMEPTFEDHEYLIIDELSYHLGLPMRGEVIVFRYPLDPKQFFIKRVVGLPGEKVQVADNKVTIFNSEHPDGFLLDESAYLASDVMTYGNHTYTLAADEYFVMGDNRTASLDSRTFGLLPRKNIVGRVWVRGWPLDRVTVFKK